MGVTMVDDKVGSLVWVRRKNGKWWPGKVLSPSGISSSKQFSSGLSVRTPVMLLGRHNGYVECYNFGNSERVKLFRCGEFDHLINKTEKCQASTCIKDGKYASREAAILHALQLEKLGGMLKRPAREPDQGAVCRAKRSRCVYSPVEHSALAPRSMKVSPFALAANDSSINSTLGPGNDSGRSASDLFHTESEDSVKAGVTHPRGCYQRQRRSMKPHKKDDFSYSSVSSAKLLTAASRGFQKQKREGKSSGGHSIFAKGKNSATPLRRTHSRRELFAGDADCQEKSGFRRKYLENSRVFCVKSMCNDYQNGMKAMLFEVDVKVEPNHHNEQVPFVCLMSRLNQKAIIGHPVDVESLPDTFEYLVRKKSSHVKISGDEERGDQLVWRSSKRTPVSYITKCPFATKHDETYETSKRQKDEGDSDDLPHSTHRGSKAYGLKAKADIERQSCVAVKFVFTNLLSAVGGEQS